MNLQNSYTDRPARTSCFQAKAGPPTQKHYDNQRASEAVLDMLQALPWLTAGPVEPLAGGRKCTWHRTWPLIAARRAGTTRLPGP